MVRALVQPLEGTSAQPAAGLTRRGGVSRRTPANPTRSEVMRPGFGLLIGAGVSVGLWVGLAELASVLLR